MMLLYDYEERLAQTSVSSWGDCENLAEYRAYLLTDMVNLKYRCFSFLDKYPRFEYLESIKLNAEARGFEDLPDVITDFTPMNHPPDPENVGEYKGFLYLKDSLQITYSSINSVNPDNAVYQELGVQAECELRTIYGLTLLRRTVIGETTPPVFAPIVALGVLGGLLLMLTPSAIAAGITSGAPQQQRKQRVRRVE